MLEVCEHDREGCLMILALKVVECRLVPAKGAFNLKTRQIVRTNYATLVCLKGPNTPVDALFVSRNHHHPKIE